MPTTVEVNKKESKICLTMRPSTAAALSIGLAQVADMPSISRRSKLFYATVAALIDDGITSSANEVSLPMSGVPVVLEAEEPVHEMPAVPTCFAGRWEFPTTLRGDGVTMQRKEQRIVGSSVYEFSERARRSDLPMPSGLIDWLVTAALESELTIATPDMKVIVNVFARGE